jgi:hypothetical protein
MKKNKGWLECRYSGVYTYFLSKEMFNVSLNLDFMVEKKVILN